MVCVLKIRLNGLACVLDIVQRIEMDVFNWTSTNHFIEIVHVIPQFEL